RRLADFLAEGLPFYGERNDPNRPVTSRLSPYLHFGQISAQRVALEVQARAAQAVEHAQRIALEVQTRDDQPVELALGTAAADFLEELIVRRELADNFCFYNPHYDSYDGFPAWARQTLDRHRADPRAYRYSSEQLETGQTADNLWNAAQQELVRQGTMPGYLRMYWAKKLLEWCASPELAMQIAINFNDGYALDGRDPNGYTGIAWSIGGVHDRPWGERPVFGTIRFMSYDGCKRKFSIEDYVRKVKEG
ncbi:MAG: Deoxyribodipyrimidine photo-lyase type, partial [Firmicutes bacterium]|nr:Deoxyribodipyrimidine photo-lyase type [Bacillota bacterium]